MQAARARRRAVRGILVRALCFFAFGATGAFGKRAAFGGRYVAVGTGVYLAGSWALPAASVLSLVWVW